MRSRQLVDTACFVAGHLFTSVLRCTVGSWLVNSASGARVTVLLPLGLFKPGDRTTVSINLFVGLCDMVVSGRRTTWSQAGLAPAISGA